MSQTVSLKEHGTSANVFLFAAFFSKSEMSPFLCAQKDHRCCSLQRKTFALTIFKGLCSLRTAVIIKLGSAISKFFNDIMSSVSAAVYSYLLVTGFIIRPDT